jgi:hypothetical protein
MDLMNADKARRLSEEVEERLRPEREKQRLESLLEMMGLIGSRVHWAVERGQSSTTVHFDELKKAKYDIGYLSDLQGRLGQFGYKATVNACTTGIDISWAN